MKFLTTYQDLNNRLAELDNIKANSNTLFCMLAGRVEAFHRQNGYDIKRLKERMQELFENHVEKNDPAEKNEKGIYKFQKQVIDNNGTPQEVTMPVFLDAEHSVKYAQEYEKLMATTFNIII